MRNKRFYTAESVHGSESSMGFANDTIVSVFSSKAARDKYVQESRNVSCTAILAKEATKYAANYSLIRNKEIKPDPFSGEYWGVCNWIDENIEGYLGTLGICNQDDDYERFYR